jgi:DNA-binding transcriptional ArsR family regulator
MEYKPKVTLTQDEFRVLASSTRIDIMKLLDESQLTVSDVSRRLAMNKATVHEHLTRLMEVGLVKKEDTDRKWVYYSLTWKGRNLLHPERVKVMVTLATIAVVCVIVGLALAMRGTEFIGSTGDDDGGDTTLPPPSARMVWQGMESDVYTAGFPSAINLELRSTSPALSIASIKSLSTFVGPDPSSTSSASAVGLTYSRVGNVITLYDRSGELRDHDGDYLLVDTVVLDGKGNEYHYTLNRLIVGSDRTIDLRLGLAGILFDLANLTPLRTVRVNFSVENVGEVDVRNATVSVCSVLDVFRGAGIPLWGSQYLDSLREFIVNVPANGTVPLSFTIPASRLHTKHVVVFIDPVSTVPDSVASNNQASTPVPLEVQDMNTEPALDRGSEAPGFGAAMAALAVMSAVAVAAAAGRRR